jgi:hypothetical protein
MGGKLGSSTINIARLKLPLRTIPNFSSSVLDGREVIGGAI